MDGAHQLSKSELAKVVRQPGFWFILVLIILITIPHYGEALGHPSFIYQLIAKLNLSRHAFERILYLAPVVWAGFLFGWRGSFITSLVALACMLPRAIAISEYPQDALFESGAVFVVGNVLAISFHALRQEREQRTQLEIAQQELRASEERYRELFENAHDAIWLHDFDGNIVAANRAAGELTGYTVEELTGMNVRSFLSDESLNLAHQIRVKMLNNELVEQPYEQRVFRRDGSEALVQLASSLVFNKNIPVAFQHIARDVTEQKRMQENLRYYLLQVTKAQEEERKRISHELHDETIQALVVLSRQLDSLTSNKDLPEPLRHRLEEIWQQTNSIVSGVRRLSQDLRPAALDRLGLLPALEWLASDVSGYSGIEIKVNVVGEARRLPEEIELVLFRITQEALRNVWRHAHARHAEITVEFDENRTRITVHDNGEGFKLPDKIGDLARDGKLGLAGMQERAQLIGGVLMVQSKPGEGTSITVEIPE
jgi:PAS domain S-box-containing protein